MGSCQHKVSGAILQGKYSRTKSLAIWRMKFPSMALEEQTPRRIEENVCSQAGLPLRNRNQPYNNNMLIIGHYPKVQAFLFSEPVHVSLSRPTPQSRGYLHAKFNPVHRHGVRRCWDRLRKALRVQGSGSRNGKRTMLRSPSMAPTSG